MDVQLKPLPMQEALEFWQSKKLVSSKQFKTLSDEAKLHAFGISGMAKGAELETVYNAIGKALREGTTFADFKKDCQTIFEKRGWVGERAWRVDNIFRTNVQTAFMVGRYQQALQVAKGRPYWQYIAVNDQRTRPAHRALNGLVFRADDPFWDTWFPPNGYRCRCGFRTLSDREMERKGLKEEKRDPTGGFIVPKDPKTGQEMPPVAVMPDKGFAFNPGKSFWAGIVERNLATNKATATAGGVAAGKGWETVPGQKTYADHGRPNLNAITLDDLPSLDAGKLLPTGKEDAFYQAEFIKRYGREKLMADAAREPVFLSLRSFQAIKEEGVTPARWKFNKAGHGECIPLLEEMITDPYEIWLTPQQDGDGHIRLTRRYICLWKDPDNKRIGGYAAFEVIDGVFQGITAFLPRIEGRPDIKYLNKQRIGKLLYGRGK